MWRVHGNFSDVDAALGCLRHPECIGDFVMSALSFDLPARAESSEAPDNEDDTHREAKVAHAFVTRQSSVFQMREAVWKHRMCFVQTLKLAGKRLNHIGTRGKGNSHDLMHTT